MKTVKIFIASSIVEFEQERDKLAARLRGLNENQHNIDFQVKTCEDYSHAETPGRKQEEFNALVRQCDFFFAIIGEKVGDATLEEIDVARKQLKKSGSALSPKIVVFFKDVKNPSAEVIRLKIKTRSIMGQYPPKFTHISEVTEGILWELIDAGAFFDPSALEQGRRTHAELVARIRDNWRKIAALGAPTAENELELALLYQENVELSRAARSEYETFYAYALFLHKRGQNAKAIEIGAELDALYIPDDDPDDRATLKELLGDCYAVLGRLEDAETYYRAALELYRALPDDSAPELADTCFKLAKVMVLTYRYEAAERLYREALTRYLRNWEEYASEIGQTCHAVYSLMGQARDVEWGFLKGAEKAFLDYAVGNPPDWMKDALKIVSNWLKEFPCPDTAAKYMEEAEAKARDMTQDKPDEYEQTLAEICWHNAKWLYKHNQMEPAEALARKALEIRCKLPDEVTIVYSCNQLAMILADTNRPGEAEQHYQEALDICRTLAEEDPAQFEPNLAHFCNNLAILLHEIARYEEAEDLHREALDIRRKLAEKDPAQFELDLAQSCNNLALLLRKTGRYEEAEDLHWEALDIRRRLAERDPAQFEPYLAQSCNIYGVFLLETKHDPVTALAYFDEAVSLFEKYPHLKAKLDTAISTRSRCKQAIWSRHGK